MTVCRAITRATPGRPMLAWTVVPSYKFVSTSTTGVMNRSEQSFDLDPAKATSVYIPPFPEYRGLAYRIEGTGFRTGPEKHIYVRKALQSTETATRTYKINEGSVDGTVFDLEANAGYIVTLDSLDGVTDFKLMTLPSVCPGGTDTMIGSCPDSTLNANVVTSCIEHKDSSGQDLTGGTCQGGVAMEGSVRGDGHYGNFDWGFFEQANPEDREIFYRYGRATVSVDALPTEDSIYIDVNSEGYHATVGPGPGFVKCVVKDRMGFLMSILRQEEFENGADHYMHYRLPRSSSTLRLECEYDIQKAGTPITRLRAWFNLREFS